MLGNAAKKKKSLPLKKEREKLLEKAKIKAKEKNSAAVLDISSEGKVLSLGKTSESASFKDSDELSKYLFQNFDVVKGGMTKISAKYLRDCVKDEKKMQTLFDNLSAADASLKARQKEIGFQGMSVKIDENGEVSMESSKSTVGFNGEKIKRQMAAAATKNDMKAVLALIEEDIKTLEDGFKNNMCDAAEVEKAKKLLDEAKEKMAKLPNRALTPEEQSIMAINMAI